MMMIVEIIITLVFVVLIGLFFVYWPIHYKRLGETVLGAYVYHMYFHFIPNDWLLGAFGLLSNSSHTPDAKGRDKYTTTPGHERGYLGSFLIGSLQLTVLIGYCIFMMWFVGIPCFKFTVWLIQKAVAFADAKNWQKSAKSA